MLDAQSTTPEIVGAQTIAHSPAHPRGLYLLFFVELWERFGFYTLQAIIILYMTKALLMPDTEANLLYAAFSALLYLTPTLGGYLADRYFGFQRAISIGGVLFVIAYLLCAADNRQIFFLGLSLLICANGFFKPNVSSIVGELYSQGDPRRDSGFTLFYMGINIGALIPPLIAGALVVRYGWHAGFLLAAAGMAIGQLIFMWGKKQLGAAGARPNGNPQFNICGYKLYGLLTSGIIVTAGLCLLAFRHPQATTYIISSAAIGIFLIVTFYLFKQPGEQRGKMLAALILIAISFAFWSLYNQAFTSLMLFADRNMIPRFLGLPFDAEATQFFNPFFILALSPLLSRVWIRMDKAGWNPSTQMKFFLGVFFMSAGFFLLALGARYFGMNGYLSPWWLAASYLLQTMGELLISPIGLAMITVLCPRELTGMMMGVWFFAQSASFALGGYLANIAAVPANAGAATSLSIYTHAFIVYGWIALLMAVASFACIPLLNRMIRGKTA
ncbi:Dipeptide and tripeptide permease A [Aquicella siphonis]|uniref:Dipeptide and tripeptide permease A n=1 Tax=Aquicella siphonis TaxID=254247 RepID=A0A5E4PE91_9COXI|nr:oligopeptide:H+ symporter [Aquicella siphonis]VVC74915.1 Dipeptide and tripeptide permease A [Aquicella siphonis]